MHPPGPALPISESTYRRIRSDIIFAELRPGAKLKLGALRLAYGASVSTLRELLNRLAAEGYVAAESQRGFAVAEVSADNLRELADLRLFLENSAIEDSFRAGDLEWEAGVVAAHHKLARAEKLIRDGHATALPVWKGYDREFHQALIAACGSQELLDLHADIYDKYLRYLMLVGLYRGEVVSREHAALLDCALARDAAAAQRILSVHVRDCVDAIVAHNTLN